MVVCSVFGCNNLSEKKYNNKNLKFHCFPKDSKMRKLWINACGDNNEFSLRHSRVCSEHFIDSDYRLRDVLLNSPENNRYLKSASVPSINVPIISEPFSREKGQEWIKNKIINECVAAFEKSSQTPSTCNIVPEKTYEDGGKEGPLYHNSDGTHTEVEDNCSNNLNIIQLNKEVRKLKRSLKRMKQKEQKEDDKMSSVRKIFTSKK